MKSKGIAAENIGLFGGSMGAATSLIALGRSTEIKTVFADSSYADFGLLAAIRLPVERGLPAFFLPGIFTAGHFLLGFNASETRPEIILKTVTGRYIYLKHGEKDSIIPLANFYKLKEAGGSQIVGSWIVPGEDHIEGLGTCPEEYLQRLKTFFDSYLGK